MEWVLINPDDDVQKKREVVCGREMYQESVMVYNGQNPWVPQGHFLIAGGGGRRRGHAAAVVPVGWRAGTHGYNLVVLIMPPAGHGVGVTEP